VHRATIRSERGDDHTAIRDVVAAAFGSLVEAALVDAIRNSPEYVGEWALVAELEGAIVGHTMVSYARLVTDHEVSRRVAMLSPLAVAPEVQRGGIGAALVRSVCARVDTAGEPCVVLEGSPAYYARFGFEPARPLGIEIPIPSWAPSEAGQLLRLANYTDSMRGTVVYPKAFDAVSDH
jgi:putative acetyltransferase